MEDDKPDVDELLERATKLDEQGSPLKAMLLLRRALEVRTDPVVLTRIGSLAIDLERWNEAEVALLAAIGLDSDFIPAYFYLGLAYRAQGRDEAALSCLERASLAEPSEYNFTILGVIQDELDLAPQARESYRRAIAIDPSHIEAYYNLGVSLRNDQKPEAIEMLQKAIEIDSAYAPAHRELGWLLRRTHQLPEAEYHLRRAIELDRSDGWAYIYLGNLMWELRDLPFAEKAFTKAIEVWPARSVPYWCLAHFIECQGRQGEAEELYRKALEINPLDAQANLRFGNYLKDIGDNRLAKQHLSLAVELDAADKRAAAALAALEVLATNPVPQSDEGGD